MQHSAAGAVPVVGGPGLPLTYAAAPDSTHILTQPSVVTTTAQVQEAHSTTAPVAGVSISAGVSDGDASVEGDKRAIYRHPLFPLMALLFEKCEQATQTPDCPSADSFDVDIQAFVHHQEQDRKPFFSDDPDLDNLMVKAIQVLRIHLLELEKVNELCQDFCQRYIACLKGKLHSENLLRSDIPDLDSPVGSPTSVTSSTLPSLQQNIVTSGVVTSVANSSNVVIQGSNVAQPASVTNLGQGQIVSGGTVYQMVQTPQGLVAQPIQQVASQSGATVIHGSTPLSQIGVPAGSPPLGHSNASTPLVISPSMLDDDDPKRKNKRGVLPKHATQVMKSWLFQHIVHPYPTEDEKRQIAGQTNLTLLQVNNWFINARRRILQPMLDASNPDQNKTKKAKTTQSRPATRFWPDSIANLQPQASASTSQQGVPPTTPSPASTPSSSAAPTPTTPELQGHIQAGLSDQPVSMPQQILLPPGAVVTADGRIVMPGGDGTPVTAPITIVNGQAQQALQSAMDLSLESSDEEEDSIIAE